jgi:uncharacterized membrane protein YqjE
VQLAGSRGVADLVRAFARDGGELLRQEARLARLELTSVAGHVARGSAQVTLGVVLLLLGALSLIAGLVLLVGDQWLPRDRYWLAALLVVVVAGAAAAWLAARGRSALRPGALMPIHTLETLKEDREWLKHPGMSGGTSS